MITRIELENFMSHEHTVIEPAAGLTVLVGPNNCGKSAVVAALQILAHNDTSTYVLRHGEREARVAVRTDDGHEIEWRRKKGGSTSYRLDGRLFDRLNRQVPDEVAEVLRLSKVQAGSESIQNEFDLHFGEQKSPVFLLNQQGAPAARFFASASDAEKLVRMQKLHKDSVDQARRDKARLSAEAAGLEETLAALEPVSEIERRVETAETLYADIGRAETEVADLDELIAATEKVGDKRTRARRRADVLSAVSPPPVLADTESLSRLIGAITESAGARKRAGEASGALDALPEPPPQAETADLDRIVRALDAQRLQVERARRRAAAYQRLEAPPEPTDTEALAETVWRLEAADGEAGRARSALDEAERALAEAREKLTAWAQTHRRCPTCGAALEPEALIRATETGFGGHAHGG